MDFESHFAQNISIEKYTLDSRSAIKSGLHMANSKSSEIEILQCKADAGDSVAQCALGLAYLAGRGVERDAKLAVYWYEQAAQAGNAVAQYNLADMYLRGDGVNQDENQALSWFAQAADQGDLDAMYNLGLLYLKQTELSDHEEQAFQAFFTAADAGLARAQFEVATLYRYGRGVALNLVEAKRWYEEAEANGVSRAASCLAELDEEG